ncbi:MAG: hypothetical protein DME27_09420 [Verrucomicrobia bacterium]|nr:MAG: hypothetical protein DMC57_05365 [Verrucomicrobiota bacterium]PYL43216.1 MAG: hypothetical protein DME29_07430 [Verrucomicrobiota bacterium]PYL96613.1 MAG: hypothetical protein DME27_09420 [Verrucomicrobiota bacterium]
MALPPTRWWKKCCRFCARNRRRNRARLSAPSPRREGSCRYGYCAISWIAVTKMTMFINEGLLARVMKLTGLKTKTQTVEFALRETERKARLTKFLGERKIAASEWKESIDPAYDLNRLRVAEKPPRYSGKRGAG